jgi:ankyrin repeat protein
MVKTKRNQKKRGGALTTVDAATKLQSVRRGNATRKHTNKLILYHRLPGVLQDKIGYDYKTPEYRKKHNEYSSKLLIEGVKENHTEKVKHALKISGVEPRSYIDKQKHTLLHLAIKNKNLEIVKSLIKSGSDIDAIDSSKGISIKLTPLLISLEQRSDDISEFLIKNGANVNIKDDSGTSPLHMTAHFGDVALSKLLIKNGAKITPSPYPFLRRATPLHIASSKSTPEYMTIAKHLIEMGANINAVDDKKETPIFLAVKINNVALVKLLLEKGANIDIQNDTQHSIMHYAAENPDPGAEILKLLIRYSHNDAVNSINETEQTPLHLAAEAGNKYAAKLLVENGADKDAVDNNGDTPIAVADEFEHIDVMDVIIDTRLNYMSKIAKTRTGGKKNKKGRKTRKH